MSTTATFVAERRTTTHPVPGTITRRKLLAQEIRNDLKLYRDNAGNGAEVDHVLTRVASNLSHLCELEGLDMCLQREPVPVWPVGHPRRAS